ncbi:hypothetical protein ABXT08_06940 [Chryseobacterium sp. NRRL B-14859]|uniref:hypothetical protein n=1 Tax=Chryseobacterium sp. NRRL B-14859 TaxID=1562763 RepID=UPI003398821F
MKSDEEIVKQNETDLYNNESISNSSVSSSDIRNFLVNSGLKIKSTGQNYELRYGDLTFSGSADLEFIEKKEETIIHHVYQVHTTYITQTKYKTKTFYKTKVINKNLDVERSGISFGELVGIIVCSLVSGVILWELTKRLIFKK